MLSVGSTKFSKSFYLCLLVGDEISIDFMIIFLRSESAVVILLPSQLTTDFRLLDDFEDITDAILSSARSSISNRRLRYHLLLLFIPRIVTTVEFNLIK